MSFLSPESPRDLLTTRFGRCVDQKFRRALGQFRLSQPERILPNFLLRALAALSREATDAHPPPSSRPPSPAPAASNAAGGFPA